MQTSFMAGRTLMFGLSFSLFSSPVSATLGQPLPAGRELVAPQALALKAAPPALYSVAQSRDETGRVIREFARQADGVVFAVAWQGPALPDMRRLLGDYFSSYVSSQQSNRAGLNRLEGRGPGLTVISAGRARAFFGLAYVPALVPAGLDIDQLK
ncbi:hypothetical protein HNO92_001243 [Chromobacterium alkanivorans]|uniref:DUF2844 domain-containing protein n=1 Tax=Chromobacterium alkanivorans TaxID=1071719 RepID=UPI0021699C66|nr:DUF2844 domain-containing protein [Chromobacterium alkanivorans]MCS3804857.1 hypothetical protein [Chromobacterium alkanivorans]MCS3819196.1 hypothetical protein [Chromobacterium alkanivorans]MCS3872946.1 hypothetical protein [Chromobacterium alkanivorans]